MTLSPKLLEILVCPLCQHPVVLSGKNGVLYCVDCQLRYPVVDGIPVMMRDDATPIKQPLLDHDETC